MELNQLAKQEFELFNIRFLNWWRLILFAQFLILSLMIGCLSTQRWVAQGSGSTYWQGSILYCNECNGTWHDQSYASIASNECQLTGLQHPVFCDQFQGLRDAGGAFIALEVISIVILVVWMGQVVTELMNRPLLPKEIVYAAPTIGVGFHMCALIQWCLVANSFYESDCQVLTDGSAKAKLCSLDGPDLALAVALLYPMLAFVFFVAFTTYNQNTDPEENPGAPDSKTSRADGGSFV